MDQGALSSDSVLEVLLRTNRPPTDEETAIIRESMAPTNAKLKAVEAQISDTMAHIQALKAQVEQAETRLQRLRKEEAAILETFADHRRVFAPFRTLPEDVLREICIASMENNMPTLLYCGWKILPYVLAQISRGMRHVALTTPLLWASMKVEIGEFYSRSPGMYEKVYSILARKAGAWFERAGGLALTLFIEDRSSTYAGSRHAESDQSNILLDTLLSYSTRFKELCFRSRNTEACTPKVRIAALTATDVPLLQSVSLHLDHYCSDPAFFNSELLTIPSLNHVTLQICALPDFTVSWAALTSLTLRGVASLYRYHSISATARALQQTKRLVFCEINVVSDNSEQHSPTEISLPFLKTLIVKECPVEISPTVFGDGPSILDLIIAPNLETLDIGDMFFEHSLSAFCRRSPHIREFSLIYFKKDKSFTFTTGLLRRCPSLAVLSLYPCDSRSVTYNANSFLRAFVENGDAGVICPRLQYLNFGGNLDFSVETLRLILEGKHGDISMPDVLQWKRVVIEFMDRAARRICKQMLDLVSLKQAEGLDVEVREYRHTYL